MAMTKEKAEKMVKTENAQEAPKTPINDNEAIKAVIAKDAKKWLWESVVDIVIKDSSAVQRAKVAQFVRRSYRGVWIKMQWNTKDIDDLIIFIHSIKNIA